MQTVRAAFVMEQALGHVTHYQNLRELTDQQADIEPVWLPIPFDVQGHERLVPVLRNTWSVRASWRARRALDATRARTPLDAVVFHTQVASLFSINMMRQVPTLISLDATPINYDTLGKHYNHRPAGRGLIDRQKYHLNWRAFHAAAGLVTWSEWARRSLIDDYGVDDDRVRVLAPGAAPSYFDVGRARLSSPERVRSEGPVRILFVGGDFRRKGGPALLEAMRGALGERCELHMATQYEVPQQRNVVVHPGLQANSPALQQLFADADLFVLPTNADCLGLVLMEAAAAGLPVIATDVGAISECVQLDESGLIIPAGDGAALTAALTALVDDPARRQRMSRAGYALARQKFDAQRNNRLLLDFVRVLVKAHPVARRAA
ncbi:MAG TPA: glycosyltransferase family 4 protein [Chloroflexota bacterium]|nr:glycosyltransferase family 4 protein [Chloroflexota bacterium]